MMLWSVYPRWRGEHTSVIAAAFYIIGLSPLARGTPDIEIPELNITRFIPAGAGNTTSCPLSLFQLPVYPRWRGEHAPASHPGIAAAGLSPLARGTHRRADVSRGPGRFIPAGAGNTVPAIW